MSSSNFNPPERPLPAQRLAVAPGGERKSLGQAADEYMSNQLARREFVRRLGLGDAEMVRESLLLHPEWAQAKNDLNEPVLLMAAAKDDLNCVCALLKAGALPNDATPQGRTALMAAASWQASKCLRVLLPVSDARAQTHDGETALMMAAKKGDTKSVAALWRASDLRARNRKGQTALACAIDNMRWDCADLLAASESEHKAKALIARAPADAALPMSRALGERAALRKVAEEGESLAIGQRSENPAGAGSNNANDLDGQSGARKEQQTANAPRRL